MKEVASVAPRRFWLACFCPRLLLASTIWRLHSWNQEATRLTFHHYSTKSFSYHTWSPVLWSGTVCCPIKGSFFTIISYCFVRRKKIRTEKDPPDRMGLVKHHVCEPFSRWQEQSLSWQKLTSEQCAQNLCLIKWYLFLLLIRCVVEMFILPHQLFLKTSSPSFFNIFCTNDNIFAFPPPTSNLWARLLKLINVCNNQTTTVSSGICNTDLILSINIPHIPA